MEVSSEMVQQLSRGERCFLNICTNLGIFSHTVIQKVEVVDMPNNIVIRIVCFNERNGREHTSAFSFYHTDAEEKEANRFLDLLAENYHGYEYKQTPIE